MKLNDIGPLIATRTLSLRSGADVSVWIGKPQKFPDSDDYYCPYKICGLGDERVKYAGGVDAVQALELTLKKIGTELYTSKEAQAKELVWNGDENLGFPVPDVLSDLIPPKP